MPREGFRRLGALLRMSRPFVIMVGVLANIVGLAMADCYLGGIDLGVAALGMSIMVLAIAMGHYADEYSDVDTDSITRRTRYSGGSGVLPSGILKPIAALRAAEVCGIAALLLTILAIVSDLLSWTYLWMLLLGLVLGLAYSMRPIALERRGLGELTNAFLGGYLMVLSGYLPQAGELGIPQLLACFPIFLAVWINLIGVHWADREADAAVGKRTLVVIMGASSLRLYPVLVLLLYLSTGLLRIAGVIPAGVFLGIAITLPLAIFSYWHFLVSQRPDAPSAFMAVLMVLTALGYLLG
ncbi:MAG: prenyltransferase [Methanomassiliicoccales archaeon]